MKTPVRMAVLISGSGRTLQNFIDLILAGRLPARIEVVVSSDPDAFGLKRANQAGIPAHVVSRRDFKDAKSFSEAVTAAMAPHEADLILLAGFLHLYRFPEKYEGRVLNIHPALLPRFGGKGFYGRRVHEAVLRAGDAESGCTVHFADHRYDRGPIILQRKVPVLPGDTPGTLADRVFQAECEAFPEAVRRVISGEVKLPATTT